MQDAARKRRAPSKTPGAWAGTIIQTNDGIVEKRVSNERWTKTKVCVSWIARQLENAEEATDLEAPVQLQHGGPFFMPGVFHPWRQFHIHVFSLGNLRLNKGIHEIHLTRLQIVLDRKG